MVEGRKKFSGNLLPGSAYLRRCNPQTSGIERNLVKALRPRKKRRISAPPHIRDNPRGHWFGRTIAGTPRGQHPFLVRFRKRQNAHQ
jgi:hypothetical protein